MLVFNVLEDQLEHDSVGERVCRGREEMDVVGHGWKDDRDVPCCCGESDFLRGKI